MRATNEQLEAAAEELEQLEALDPFAAHAAAHEKVLAAQAAYNAKKSAIEGNGVVAVRPNPHNGQPLVVGPLRALRAALDAAFADRASAEALCRRVQSLRNYLEKGSAHAEFTSFEAPKLTPAQAAAAGGKALVWNPETGKHEWRKSERAPVPVGAKAWREELARRRAAGDQREAERRAAKDRIRRSKTND